VDGMSLYEYVRSTPTLLRDAAGRESSGGPWTPAVDKQIKREEQDARWLAPAYRALAQKTLEEGPWDTPSYPDIYDDGPQQRGNSRQALIALYKELADVKDREAYDLRHDKRHSCGPGVTENVENVLRTVRTEFPKLDKQMQCKMCTGSFSLSAKSGRSWDIWDLHMIAQKSPSGRRGSEVADVGGEELGWNRSVSIGGKCYDAATANYVLYGAMGKLCYEAFPLASHRSWLPWKFGNAYSLDNIKANVSLWKAYAYQQGVPAEATGWVEAGYRGWPEGGDAPRSTTPYPVRKNAPGFRAYAGQSFTPIWEPWWPR